MESLGAKLRKAREEKGYSFEQVCRETNIAARYIEALESEDFSKFPGEPYVLGFLRNYGEYLGLNVDSLIASYRSIKMQEQPLPEELLHSKRSFNAAPLIIGIAAAAVLALGGGAAYYIVTRPKEAAPVIVESRTAQEYALEEGALERRLYPGDTVLFPIGEERFVLEFSGIDESVHILTPEGDVAMNLSDEKALDLNEDGIPDITIVLSDFAKNDPAKGAQLHFEAAEQTPPQGSLLEDLPIPAGGAMSPPIFTSPTPYPFTLQAAFSGYCMFRWESDNNPRQERYFQERAVQDVPAQNRIRIWLSNASAVKLQIIGGGKTVDLNAGGLGEVAVKYIHWVPDDAGRYKLVSEELD
jgi:cytoskeletal protein RodZ